MKRLITICVVIGLMFAVGTPVANAAYIIGTPSPTLNPVFGTLVDFDDQAAGTVVGQFDYVAWGVSSITELTSGATIFRWGGTQSMPNYVGTSPSYDLTPFNGLTGWDGTIRIDLALPASQIGIGVANSQDGEILSVYNSGGTLLESWNVHNGANVYSVITRGAYDISCIELSGAFWAIDDLQFNAIPAPGAILLGSLGVGLVGWLRRRRTL